MEETFEDIVLRHSGRGMDELRKHMTDNYAEGAAKDILSWKKGNILLATGFYVSGFAETDGPAGTVFLALALKSLGYNPVIVTDFFAKGFFEYKDIEAVYMSFGEEKAWCEYILAKYNPVGLISIERCGKNLDGKYANMRGVDISETTSKVDILFEMAYGKIPTIGVGDGGNEIGMGNMAHVITEKLSLNPCVVKVDRLVIATVSNWGAYAITAYLEKLSGKKVFMGFDDVLAYISKTVDIGSVDGVLKQRVVSVDGFSMDIEREIIEALEKELC